ncbi:MAG: tetratricopeptide repeat protein, partial [Myxococcales bacterium]
MQERLGQARALYRKGSPAEARPLFESLLPELRKQPDKADLALALMLLGQIAIDQGDYQRGADWSREAADAYRAAGDQTSRMMAVNNFGRADVYRGAYASALASYEEVLAFARASGNREAQIEELNNIGNVHYYEARYLEAREAYQDALKLVDQARSEPWAPRRRRITLLNQAA